MKSLLKSKTFWAGVVSVLTGVGGFATKTMDIATAGQFIIGGLSAIFLRDGIRKI